MTLSKATTASGEEGLELWHDVRQEKPATISKERTGRVFANECIIFYFMESECREFIF
jgi:hypothetical protein